jgi:hypothetical protein
MDNISVITDNRSVLNQTAQLVFESFENTDITFALVSKQGRCITNRPNIVSEVFSNQKLLDSLCQRIDDGDEPTMAYVGDYLVAGSGLLIDEDNNGFVIMILPGYTPEKASASMDFIEVILSQILLLAREVGRNMESSLTGAPFDFQLMTEGALN